MLFDIPDVAKIYDEMHDAEEAGKITTGWQRGVYPVRATAEAALQRGDLYVLEYEGKICGTALINQLQVDVYKDAPWEHEVPEEQVCVLHTLAISPRAGGRGLGRQFVAFYEEYAREKGCTELRIDTNERNTRARALYESLGYREIDIVPTVFNGIPGINLVLIEKYIG